MKYNSSVSRSISSDAIVLSSKPFSEADKLITVLSRKFGKMTLVAKGVRRLKSRKCGSLEVFSQIKFMAHITRGLSVVTEVEPVNNFTQLRRDLKKVAVAYFFTEAVLNTTRDEEKHEEVYELLTSCLKKLEQGTELKRIRKEFSIKLAELLGFIPERQFVPDPDELLESIIERRLASVRVGKKLQI